MFGVKTVDGILRSFSKMIDELEVIIEKDTTSILENEQEIRALELEKSYKMDNMKRAMSVRSKLSDLIGD